MAERIDLPPTLQGDEKAQLQQVWSYLYQLSEALNNNLDAIGGNELTDAERVIMQEITAAAGDGTVPNEYETLKSLIIKTADFVRTSIQEYRMVLYGETVAGSQFGQYSRRTGLDVSITPEGILQKYSLREIVQDLKKYEINAKNYIKTGLLRTVNSIPVYGVAIGKDVVTFSEDGTETYNDSNKVAELTADELAFFQGSNKIASYTGSKISFYYNGTETFYIQNGKLYAKGDMEITNGKKMIIASGGTLKIASGGNLDVNASGTLNLTGSTVSISSGSTFDVQATNFAINSANKYMQAGNWRFNEHGAKYSSGSNDYFISDDTLQWTSNTRGGLYFNTSENGGEIILYARKANGAAYGQLIYGTSNLNYTYLYSMGTEFAVLGQNSRPFVGLYTQEIIGRDSSFNGNSTKMIEFVFDQNYSPPNTVYRYLQMFCEFNDANKDIQILASGNVKFRTSIDCGYIYYDTLVQHSSRFVKSDIKKLESVGEKLDELEPVTFIYKKDQTGKRRAGLIYEDTVNVMPEICSDIKGDRAINYVELIPMLLKEIQDLRARVKALEER